MGDPKKITQEEYGKGFIDFYQPFEIVNPLPSPTVPALPDLGASTGIKTTVEKPDLDVNIKKINDVNFQNKSKEHFNIFSGKNFNPANLKYNTMKDMTSSLKLDKVGPMSTDNILLNGATGVMGFAMKGDYGFGEGLEGPTGQSVFSVGKLSEMALENHMKNFSATNVAYQDMKKQVRDGKVSSEAEYLRTNDMGFAAVIGRNHFSRSPGSGMYNGHKSHLHSDSHTAHMMLKSMEALSKGLDPRGGDPKKMINLKGYEVGQGADNSENRGVSAAALPNGMGAITEDGYYTYVSGSSLGHTKSRLYGLGDLSETLAKQLRASGKYGNFTTREMVDAMTAARTKGSKGFTAEMAKYLKKNNASGGYEGAKLQGGLYVDNNGNSYNFPVSTDNPRNVEILNQYLGTYTPPIGISSDEDLVNAYKTQYPQTVGTGTFTSGSSTRPDIPPWKQPNPERTGVHILDTQRSSSLPAFKKAVQDQYGDGPEEAGRRQLAASVRKKAEAAAEADRLRDEREATRAKAKEIDKQVERSTESYGGRWVGGLASGGQVSSPVGQLASMLRSNRLGYNQGGAVQSGYYGYQEGGQINMQEMGFVNGKTPDQVTDAQSVADTEAMSADEGDFVINAPAVEAVGVEAIVGLVLDALALAAEEGVEIIDIPQDTSPKVMVDILVSEGEFIVPRELIPFIDGGVETLEKINALGTDEVTDRVDDSEMMMPEEMPMEEQAILPEAPIEQEMTEIPDVPQPELPALNTGGSVYLDPDQGFI